MKGRQKLTKLAKNKKIHCPQYLSKQGRKLWNEIREQFEINDSVGLKILLTGLESFDRARAAREQIDKEGMTISDRFGVIKPHPLLGPERDARAAFLSALKQLNLDLEPLRDGPGRPT